VAAGEGGTGPLVPVGRWPEDPAGPDTPVAGSAAEVADLAGRAVTLDELVACQSVCRACPRLVAWREEIAVVRRRSFRDERYWGRPIPGWGSARPRMLIVGLAPAAHGGNRTGRIFTGDRSGDVLFAALHRAGLSNQATSVSRDDGLALVHTRIFAAVRCAPPDNKPTPQERDTCAPWLHRELAMLRPSLRVVIALGAFAWAAFWPAVKTVYGVSPPTPRPAFGHGARADLAEAPTLLGCYHVSQQNTFTGRLTPAMLDDVLASAIQIADEA
jgi:uracil-DNA glycosylase family 4